jgi:hypothetical protein
MKRYLATLVGAVTMMGSASGQHFELSLDRRAAADALTLTPQRPTTIDRAVRAIEQQIEDKRAADAARSPLQPFWEAGFWSSPLMKLIPVAGGTQRYAEDPYVTPDYLTVARQQSEYQLKLSDKRALSLFGK